MRADTELDQEDPLIEKLTEPLTALAARANEHRSTAAELLEDFAGVGTNEARQRDALGASAYALLAIEARLTQITLLLARKADA